MRQLDACQVKVTTWGRGGRYGNDRVVISEEWKEAFFHQWGTDTADDESVQVTVAIIEWPDGSITEEAPSRVRFLEKAVAKVLMEES